MSNTGDYLKQKKKKEKKIEYVRSRFDNKSKEQKQNLRENQIKLISLPQRKKIKTEKMKTKTIMKEILKILKS